MSHSISKFEALEGRQLLSAAWGWQAKMIGQDKLSAELPQINGSGESIAIVDSGVDSDFAKARPLYKIVKPPFYAAWHTPALHDSYTGIRINSNGQVLDLHANAIPGLYACGDSAGGFGQHGICRASTFGRLSGWHAASQQI